VYLRQLALVAEDLKTVQQQLFDLFGIEEAFVDEGVQEFGLQNIVMTLGQTFLEVVSPLQDGTTAGRLLQRRGGDGGYMVIVQADDCALEQQRVVDAGINIVWQVDNGKAKALHMHPRDVPGAITSIDQMTPPEEWYWAGPNWASRAASSVTELNAAEIQCEDPEAVAQRWSLAYGRPVQDVDGVTTLLLDRGRVRFVKAVDDRGDGLRAIDIQTQDPVAVLERAEKMSLPVSDNSVTVCGTVMNFVEV
jgi:hypothetical protein